MGSNLKIKSVTMLFFGTLVLLGCQTQVPSIKNVKFSNMFEEYKPGLDISKPFESLDTSKIEYDSFDRENTIKNVKIAISNSQKVQAAISKVERSKKEVDFAKSSKSFQTSGTLSGGARREDDESELAVVAQISAQKLMYDFGATDASIDARQESLEVTKLDALIEAEDVALQLFEALIEFNKAIEINRIFEEGMVLAEPLLGQIKNISLSGIADKSSLLEAQEKYTRLEIGLEKSRSAVAISKTNFLNLFQVEGVDFVEKIDPIQVNFQPDEIAKVVRSNYQLRRQLHFKNAIMLDKKALQVGDSPTISFSTSLVAPAKDFSQDSVASAGLAVDYIFNDGGSRNAQIGALRAEIEAMNRITYDIESKLTARAITLNQEYTTAKKTQFSLEDVLALSEELRDTSKAQLISGRSSVQEILSAEVKLAEIKIELITAEALATLVSYRFNAITGELLDSIKWDLPQE